MHTALRVFVAFWKSESCRPGRERRKGERARDSVQQLRKSEKIKPGPKINTKRAVSGRIFFLRKPKFPLIFGQKNAAVCIDKTSVWKCLLPKICCWMVGGCTVVSGRKLCVSASEIVFLLDPNRAHAVPLPLIGLSCFYNSKSPFSKVNFFLL